MLVRRWFGEVELMEVWKGVWCLLWSTISSEQCMFEGVVGEMDDIG